MIGNRTNDGEILSLGERKVLIKGKRGKLSLKYEMLNPTTLNDKWFIKAGFTYIHGHFVKDKLCAIKVSDGKGYKVNGIHIRFLHQLQNIYLMYMEKDLEFKPLKAPFNEIKPR